MAAMTLMTSKGAEWLGDKRLAFLVGSARSGTTWLQLLLSRSPSVATAQETDLFNIFLRPMVDEWNRCRRTGQPGSLSEVLGEDAFRDLLSDISGFVFAKIARSKPDATVVLEKTPQHVRCWREIHELWPDAHFIHIIRDPRSVAASLRAAATNWGPAWGTFRISTITERWVADVREGMQILSEVANYQQVTYAELMADGPGVLQRLFDGLGVVASLEECRGYVEQCSIEKLRAANLDNAPFDLERIGMYRFRTGDSEGWHKELSKWEIALVENVAGPLMSELGFATTNRSTVRSAFAAFCCASADVVTSAKYFWQRFAERLRPV